MNTKKNVISTEEIEYLSQVVWKNITLNKYIEEQIVVENNISLLKKLKSYGLNCYESLDALKNLNEILDDPNVVQERSTDSLIMSLIS